MQAPLIINDQDRGIAAKHKNERDRGQGINPDHN